MQTQISIKEAPVRKKKCICKDMATKVFIFIYVAWTYMVRDFQLYTNGW